MFEKCVCIYFPYHNITEMVSFKNRCLKQQESNLQSLKYESGILPFQPILLKYTKSCKVQFKTIALVAILKNGEI